MSRSEFQDNPLLRWQSRLARIAGRLAIQGTRRKMSKTEIAEFAKVLFQVAHEMERFIDDKNWI